MKTITATGLIALIASAIGGVKVVRDAGVSQTHVAITARILPFSSEDRTAALRAYSLAKRADAIPRTRENLPRISGMYRSALAAHSDPIVRLSLASVLAQEGDSVSEAREIYREFAHAISTGRLSVGGSDPEPFLRASEAAAQIGLPEVASIINHLLTQGPIHQIDARFRLPELDQEPSHAGANGLFAAGVGMLRVHRNAEAVPLFQRAIRERPDWGTARFMLAYAHAYAGHKEEADKAFADAARYGWKRPRGL